MVPNTNTFHAVVGKCLQFVKEPSNKVDKNAVTTISQCKEKGDWPCATKVSMIVSMFQSVPHCALNIFGTGRRVNYGGEYGLEILANFHLYRPAKNIKLGKK